MQTRSSCSELIKGPNRMQTVDSNPGSNLSPTCRQLGEYLGQPAATLGHLPTPTLSFKLWSSILRGGMRGWGWGRWVSGKSCGYCSQSLRPHLWGCDPQVRPSCLQGLSCGGFADGHCSCHGGPSCIHLAQGPEYKVFPTKSKTSDSAKSQLKVGLKWIRKSLSLMDREKADWPRSACDKTNVGN